MFDNWDRKKVKLAIILIVLGVSLRIALANEANIEPVLALSMISGLILGGWYALFVPLLMMVLSDWAIYVLDYGDLFGWDIIMGITFFTWTGMILAGFFGRLVKPKFLFRLKGVAIFTGAALVMTIIYDLWTMTGFILIFEVPPWDAFAGQVTYSIYHILSTLIFAPLFGTIYIYVHEYGVPSMSFWKSESQVPDGKE